MNQEVKMKPSYLKIAFLDRDGTLIKDYPDEKWREIKEPEFLEGSIEGLKRLKEMGYDFKEFEELKKHLQNLKILIFW